MKVSPYALLLVSLAFLASLEISTAVGKHVDIDAPFASVLPLLKIDGASDAPHPRIIVLDSNVLQQAPQPLESITSLISLRATLGLKHIHELNDKSAIQLIAALSQPLPKSGDSAAVTALLRSTKIAVKALLDSRSDNLGGGQGRTSNGEPPVPILSYPLLRRATVARLMAVWAEHLAPLRGRRFGDWFEPAVADVVETLLLLFRLHRSGMQSRQVLEFMHISKAAGTSMCHTAQAAQCRALDFGMGRTCLMREFDDQPRWINATHHWTAIAPTAHPFTGHPTSFMLYGQPRSQRHKRTCTARQTFLTKRGLDFFANEYTVYNNDTLAIDPPPQPDVTDPRKATANRAASYRAFVGNLNLARRDDALEDSGGAAWSPAPSYSSVVTGAHLCANFSNVVVLRDPVARLMSHLKFITHTYTLSYEWTGLSAAFAPGRDAAAWWVAFLPAVMDNYMVRTLGGEGVFALSHGSMKGEPYLSLATAMLAQYDVLLVLESAPTSLNRTSFYGLGWAHSLPEFQLRSASHLSNAANAALDRQRSLELLPQEHILNQLVQNAVQYDKQLYRYGKILAGLDDVVWRVAENVLREPLPGFAKDLGARPRCGYTHAEERHA